MKDLYLVDWSDPPYLQIIATNDKEFGRSFTECKRIIIEKYQADRDFARNQIEYFTKLSRKKWKQDGRTA